MGPSRMSKGYGLPGECALSWVSRDFIEDFRNGGDVPEGQLMGGEWVQTNHNFELFTSSNGLPPKALLKTPSVHFSSRSDKVACHWSNKFRKKRRTRGTSCIPGKGY